MKVGRPYRYHHSGFEISRMLEAIDDFQGVDNTQAAIEVARRLEQQGSTASLLYSGDVLLESARRHEPIPSKKNVLLTQAAAMWRRSIQLRRVEGSLDSYSGRALMRLATLPLHRSFLLSGSMPSGKRFRRAYWDTVEAGMHHLDSLNAAPNDVFRSELVGNTSEIEVLALLQRFGLRHGGRKWMAVLSDLTEDMAPRADERWDISVYELLGGTNPAITHKVQVKSMLHLGERTYAPDIALVHPMDELGLEGRRIGIGTIIRDCEGEFTNPDQFTPVLDARTERLLDLLDQAS